MVAGLVSLAAALMASTTSGPFSGIGKAIDGDSLMVGDEEVRLFGIDAPEFKQSCTRSGQRWACGKEAANRLGQLVSGKLVRCLSLGQDQHGRTLARCSVAGGDINRTMVATGYALAFRRYSVDYVAAEQSAKLARRGIWSGEFQAPSEVRQADDLPITQPSASPPERAVRANRGSRSDSSCRIKGNRGRNGWIYHLPGMPYYAETVAEEMFCSEEQARVAGYRRARSR